MYHTQQWGSIFDLHGYPVYILLAFHAGVMILKYFCTPLNIMSVGITAPLQVSCFLIWVWWIIRACTGNGDVLDSFKLILSFILACYSTIASGYEGLGELLENIALGQNLSVKAEPKVFNCQSESFFLLSLFLHAALISSTWINASKRCCPDGA